MHKWTKVAKIVERLEIQPDLDLNLVGTCKKNTLKIRQMFVRTKIPSSLNIAYRSHSLALVNLLANLHLYLHVKKKVI